MTKREQRKFINDICKSLRESLLAKADKLPENWNGIEIREWIKAYYEANYCGYAKAARNPKQMRAYRNAVIVNNLT